MDGRPPTWCGGHSAIMNFPKGIWATRFDCLKKADILGLKSWIKDGCSGKFKKVELAMMNRWKYIPMLLPFLGSHEAPYSELASMKIGDFIRKFFVKNITCEEVEGYHKEITITWFQAIHQHKQDLATLKMPRTLTQTTWNIEGEKAVCYSPQANRHKEIKQCIRKGVVLLQEIRANPQELARWSQTYPNSKIVATPAGTDANGTGLFGGVGVAWDTLLFGVEADTKETVPHFVVQASFIKQGEQITYVSAYLRPTQQLVIINAWKKSWRKAPPGNCDSWGRL